MMENNPLPELQRLLAQVSASMPLGAGEQLAPLPLIETAQHLGCDVAGGATYTKLISAIEATIAELATR